VEVIAHGTGSEASARQITVRHIVSGPVTHVDPARNEIEVIGQTVRLSPATRAGGDEEEQPAVATAFPLHSVVQVSGMRRGDGVVVASRVSRVEAHGLAQVVGPVTKLDSGIVWVAGTAVRTENRTPISIGDEVQVVGYWDGSAIVARSVESIPRVPFDGRVVRVEIEGFARQTAAAQLQVGPFSVELPPAAAQEVPRLSVADARVRIQAVVQDGHVIAQRIGVLDELPSLPPLSQRDVSQKDVSQRDIRGSNGSRPNDGREGIGAVPPDQSEIGVREGSPAREGQGTRPERGGGFAAPEGPGSSDRPSAPQIPDRPPAPQIPERPHAPQILERPPRPERPLLPVRPDIRGRP
jgi:hypothetical protein